MFGLKYSYRELTRRSRSALLTVLGLSLGVLFVIPVAATSSELSRIQTQVLGPLSSIGTDLLVTRVLPPQQAEGPPSEDIRTLQLEREAAIQATVLDLANQGKPGDHFVHDFFLPGTQLTFPATKAADSARLPGVASVSAGLTLIVNHREGTVPAIIAEYTAAAKTIDLSPMTREELAQLPACVQRYRSSHPLPPPPPLPTKSPGSSGPATALPLSDAYLACLPARMRQIAIEQDVIQQVINPPKTDIHLTGFTIAGVDITNREMGLITPAQIVKGAFLSRSPDEGEAILQEAYALRKGLSVGAPVVINGTSFKVVGLAQPPLGGLTADVYLPLSELQRLSDRAGRINLLMIRVDRAADVARVSKAIEAAFPGARVASAKALADRVSGSLVDATRVVDQLGRVLALVVLAVAFLIASLATLASVHRRGRELGTLRALGWRKSRVVRQIVIESVLQGIAGGVLGIGLGIMATFAIGWFTPPLQATATPWSEPLAVGEHLTGPAVHQTLHLEPHPDMLMMLLALALAMLGGLIAGTAGSLRAARLRPAAALRDLG